MKKLNKIGIVCGVFAATVGASFALNSCSQTKAPITNRPNLIVSLEEQNKKEVYHKIEGFINDYYGGKEKKEGYVDFMAVHSREIRKNIEESGREKVVESYRRLHKHCLDLAVSRLFQEISEQDIDELGDRLVLHQKNSAKHTYIDYEHPAVKEGYKKFGKDRAGFYKKLIESNIKNTKGDFKAYVERAYNPDEYPELRKNQGQSTRELYNGFAKSLENCREGCVGPLVRILGPGVVQRTREWSEKFNSEYYKDIYQN